MQQWHPRRICVFCGSAKGRRPEYAETAVALGRLLAEQFERQQGLGQHRQREQHVENAQGTAVGDHAPNLSDAIGSGPMTTVMGAACRRSAQIMTRSGRSGRSARPG